MFRRAIVNYHVSYVDEDNTHGCYDTTKWLYCDENGKVTEEVCKEWENSLKEMETTQYEKNNALKIKRIGIPIISFYKFDV